MNEAPLLIAALVILAIWGTYLFPTFFGRRRSAPLNSTEEFDRWTHLLADVQRRSYNSGRLTVRDSIRSRRRRVLGLLLGTAALLLIASFVTGKVAFLLGHLLVDALIAAYVALLLQVRQQQVARVAALHHPVDHAPEGAEPQIRIVANS